MSEGERGRAIATPLFTLRVSRADVTLEERRAEDASPLWMLPPVCMSVCLCGHVERSEGNRAVQVGGGVGGGGWFGGRATLQISPAILHDSRCSNRFHAGLCLVSSSG